MKGQKLLFTFAFFLTISVFCQVAEALPVKPPKGATLFEQGGLYWLGPEWSTDISYNQMLNNFTMKKSDFYGFRYATLDEFIILSKGFGLIESDQTGYLFPDQSGLLNLYDEVFLSKFFSNFEPTHTYQSVIFNMGLLSFPGDRYKAALAKICESSYSSVPNYHGYFLIGYGLSYESSYPEVGSWLVFDKKSKPKTEPVPEPSTILLTIVGLFILLLKKPFLTRSD